MGQIYKIKIQAASLPEEWPHLFPGRSGTYYVSSANHRRLAEANARFMTLGSIETDALSGHVIYPFKNFLYSTPSPEALEEIFAKLMAESDGGLLKYAVYVGRGTPLEEGAFYLDTVGGQRRYQWRIVDTRSEETSLADTFPHLIGRVMNPDARVVVSFGAGGLRFFAHGTAMKFFNATGLLPRIDEVWGTGGGAFSAYAYAKGVPPEAFEQKGYDLYHEQYRYDRSTFSGRLLRLFSALLAQFNADLLKRYSEHILKMHMIISQMVKDRPLLTPFYCVAYNPARGHNQIFSTVPQELPTPDDFITSLDSVESIIAMSCIPIVHIPEHLRKSSTAGFYMDGSIAEDTSIFSIYRKWMYDRRLGLEKRRKLLIVSLNTFPQMAKSQWLMKRYVDRLLPLNVFRAIMQLSDIVVSARFREHAEILSLMSGVEVLRINFPLETSSFLDGRVIPTIIQNAQTSLLKELRELECLLASSQNDTALRRHSGRRAKG